MSTTTNDVQGRLQRAPSPRLRHFVRSVWISHRGGAGGLVKQENVLPSGEMHLVIRLSEEPIVVYGGHDRGFRGYAAIGGPRACWYEKLVSCNAMTLGVQLLPGTAEALFGAPAAELAGKHVDLEDCWGLSASMLREELMEARTAERRMGLLEAALAARLPAHRALHPAVAGALQRLSAGSSVRDVVQQSGYSHRGFVSLFRRHIGLTPKLYSRLLRFQRVLVRAAANSKLPFAELAADAGYSDQAHFTREFREFAGMTPEAYRRAAPEAPQHVPVTAPRL